ncbi:MAG: hypothetical protein ACI89D_000103 [Bermanella sp.]|jgi:hypothetical protein
MADLTESTKAPSLGKRFMPAAARPNSCRRCASTASNSTAGKHLEQAEIPRRVNSPTILLTSVPQLPPTQDGTHALPNSIELLARHWVSGQLLLFLIVRLSRPWRPIVWLSRTRKFTHSVALKPSVNRQPVLAAERFAFLYQNWPAIRNRSASRTGAGSF